MAERRSSRVSLIALATLVVAWPMTTTAQEAQAPVVAAQPASAKPAPAAAPAATRWTDPDGRPLPFRTDEELLEFLRTAEVKSEKELSGGITLPLKLLLEKDGVRANAVFRNVDEQKTNVSLGPGRSELFFRDSYIFEPAAYELSVLLGLDNVPPATIRKLRGRTGSVQIWVENAMTEGKRLKDNVEAPDRQRWNKQVQIMNVFDALVYNTDRNRGNMLITPDWKVWMIDHTRAFRRQKKLQAPEGLKQCERGLYHALRMLDGARVEEKLKPYLRKMEIEAILARRDAIVARVDALIAERGEDVVLYTYHEPSTAPAPASVN